MGLDQTSFFTEDIYALEDEVTDIVISEIFDELVCRGLLAIIYEIGHSKLKVKMRETNTDLACEVSGHISFKHSYFGYDDTIEINSLISLAQQKL